MGGNSKAELHSKEQQRRLSKAELLSPKFTEEEVFIDHLGGSVLLRSLSVDARTKLRQEAKLGTDEFNEDRFELLAITFAVIDPKLTIEDVEALKQQDSKVIDELSFTIQMMNMFGAAGRGELKKELRKTLSSDSG